MVDSSKPKRRVVLVVVLASVAVLLVCCVGTVILAQFAPEKPKPEAAVEAPPAYTVASTDGRRVVLIQADATADSARLAIRHWVDHNDAGEYRDIEVVRSADAKLYVCWGRYVRTEQVSQLRTGGEVKGPFPALAIHCP